MSDPQADLDLKELETVLLHASVEHYAIVSSLCLYVYDYMLTLPAEVQYFWGTPRSFVKRLFFWNRYFVFPVIAYWTLTGVDPTDSSFSMCLVGEAAALLLAIVCVAGAQVIMQLRVHALYGQNRTLKTIISSLFFIAVSSELGITIAKLIKDKKEGYVRRIPFLNIPLDLCITTVPTSFVFYPFPMMIFDTILLVLVIYKAYQIQREETFFTSQKMWTGSRIVRIMFRDSAIYFFCTVGVNLFNLLIWAVAPYDLLTVGTAWAITVPVMAASRVLFNMRKAYHEPTTEIELEVGTEFQVATPPPKGSNGPTVWSGSSQDAGSSVDPSFMIRTI
ncbi:hypothetical protein FB451DRAFT_1375089 [Mycena latifolia]|nr:hypothetical protein FB451DRAFT_1375089 [Mycena latifolia]